ncbi:hypothetical protein [Streptomyces albipurpureus]|uniref:Uncharacterized protein n=1 Tax=Streptomyces albipurpureus TaxID=2897419 RepID=A0ABT0UH23_9ACTN|nr:hypothetical protein [Streptomyces sp. CWNU-1]MCM2387395.1 hypothetical protein [Streptomyces sp. CWNU-1]
MAACGPEATEHAAIRQSDVLSPAEVINELAGVRSCGPFDVHARFDSVVT